MSRKASAAIEYNNARHLGNHWVNQEAYKDYVIKKKNSYPDKFNMSEIIPISDGDQFDHEDVSILKYNKDLTETASAGKVQLDLGNNIDPVLLRKKLVRLKNIFEISYQDLAQISNINHSAIRNFLESETRAPRKETLERYQALIDVLDLLFSRFVNKPLMMKAALKSKSEAFSEMSLIEYSQSLGDEGIFALRGELRRMYE